MNEWTVPAVVSNVHDGDTITVTADLGWCISFVVHVRVAHINAPELATAEGKAARDFLATIIPIGSVVTLTSHSLDKYGRTLGTIVTVGSMDIAALMIAAGHAVPYEGGPRT